MDGRWHLGLGIISAVLQVVAFVCPGWLRFTEAEKGYSMGIWYMCVPSCVAYDSQSYGFVYESVVSITVFMNSDYWLEFQVETTIAMFATVVGILLVVGSARRPSSNPKMFKAYALVFFLIAGVTLWVPAGTFASFYATWTTSQLPRIVFPYAAVIAGIAASILLLVALLLLVDLCMKPRRLPQTQTQVIKHPQPYIIQHERVHDTYQKEHPEDVYLHRSPYLGPYMTVDRQY